MICEAITAELSASHDGLTALAQLVAIYVASGTTGAAEIAAKTGYSERAVRKAKAELGCRNSGAAEPGCRNPGAESGTPVPQAELGCRNSGADSSRAHATKESLRDTSLKEDSVSQSAREGFNDATQTMVADVLAFMGPIARDLDARNWLTGTIAAYGAERTARAWTIITAKRAAGQPVPNPLALWSKTAQGLKDSPKTPVSASADVLPFKVTVAMHPNARPRDEVMGAVNA